DRAKDDAAHFEGGAAERLLLLVDLLDDQGALALLRPLRLLRLVGFVPFNLGRDLLRELLPTFNVATLFGDHAVILAVLTTHDGRVDQGIVVILLDHILARHTLRVARSDRAEAVVLEA